MKGQSFQTCFVIPIVTINGKAFGNAFLHIGCFSIYSKLPCSAQEHSQADHCKGYRDSTAAHVNQPDTCLTECKTYLVPPISKQTSPAARRKLCVSNIKPYGNHSREEYRRTVHFFAFYWANVNARHSSCSTYSDLVAYYRKPPMLPPPSYSGRPRCRSIQSTAKSTSSRWRIKRIVPLPRAAV